LEEFNDTATRWVYGWSRLIMGHKEAEVMEVKPSQNLPLHSKTALKPYHREISEISTESEYKWRRIYDVSYHLT